MMRDCSTAARRRECPAGRARSCTGRRASPQTDASPLALTDGAAITSQSWFLIPLSRLRCATTSAVPRQAVDYASAISAYRRAHGLPAVRSDGRLGAVALKQAQAMAATGTVSHSVGGNFVDAGGALRKIQGG